MRLLRAVVIAVLLAAAVYAGYRVFGHRPAPAASSVAIYYCKTDGQSLERFVVSVNPNATDRTSVAFYATAQAVAGPPSGVSAIRFPAGTLVRSVIVTGSTASVDLGGALLHPEGGSFAEDGEFKALVWTLTSLSGISAVQVKIGGARVASLPGGHFELDEPLTRQSF